MITRRHDRGFYGTRGATYSNCERYRYTLWDIWRPGKPQINFLMLNPSTANEIKNDPTIERCSRRARQWGYGGLWITNIFAYRATDPKDMMAFANPIGKQNMRTIIDVATKPEVERVVCAWGSNGGHMGRSCQVMFEFNHLELDLKCYALRFCDDGEPQHPLYVPYGELSDLLPMYEEHESLEDWKEATL